ncbi:hypothetical protein [Streptomyces sp. NPDC059460]|uniref:hypothetical protein n=1 Tax=Streptomyces sp. NPDC059460 TaxID=3346840 RepID=UPI003680886B
MQIRTCLRRAFNAVLALLIASAALWIGAPPAAAHRDGCHRWHSCPSDTGSYVCGDRGYFTYCGYSSLPSSGSGSGAEDEGADDFEAPDRPRTKSAKAVAGGRVTVIVTAEKESRIEVRDAEDSVVSRATATGSAQTVTFKAKDGDHTYSVVAVDTADNASEASEEFSVTVDASRPEASKPVVTAADAVTGAVQVSFEAEAGARYEVSVEGRKEQLSGTVGDDGMVRDSLWLPNGSYRLTAVVRDEVGNRTRAEVAATVSLDKLRPQVHVEPPVGGGTTQVEVTGPPGAAGIVSTGGESEPVRLDSDGRAAVSISVDDGSHRALVNLNDAFGRSGTGSSGTFTVDTIPPALRLVYDAERAKYGDVVLTVTGERGARLALSGAGEKRSVTLGAERRTFRWHAAPGNHRLVARLIDAHGNINRTDLTVHVSDDWTAARIRNALLWTAGVVLVLVIGGFLLWRRRRAVIAWWARRRENARMAAEQRAARVRVARQEADARRRREALRRAQEAYERELAGWQRTRDRLAADHDFVRQLRGTEYSAADFRWGARKRDERVLLIASASLVEVRTRQGVSHTENTWAGEIAVTDKRVLFAGVAGRREWAYGKWLHHEHHEGAAQTLITVSSRQKTSGVAYGYGEAPKVRLAIDLALAQAQGRHGEVVHGARAALEAHDRKRPTAPTGD